AAAGAGAGAVSTAPETSAKPLRISADAQLHRLIASRFAPAQSAPQMDLFFDNPVVALANGIVRSLSARNIDDAQRQLDRLYAHAPNHADLAAFDRLVTALGHLNQVVSDPQTELDFLLSITPTAKRLLGSQSRDLLAPLWRQVADALGPQSSAHSSAQTSAQSSGHTPPRAAALPFSSAALNLHRSFALSQAQDWAGVRDAVLAEPDWWQHSALCLRLAQSAYHQRRRIEALTAWCHMCWRHPKQAAEALVKHRQPDAELTSLWQRFLDSEEELSQPGAPRLRGATAAGAKLGTAGTFPSTPEPPLAPSDFPAWLLLSEPALAELLPVDLPPDNTPSEQHYRCVHLCIQARRSNRQKEEIAQRKQLQAGHPVLFRYLLKQSTKR
ncbi:MAG: hypothetical protein ABI885_18805, partial [Gammaproteobacteria bacterium]